MNHTKLEDKIALRELVDKLSILADKKDYSNLVQSFTEDGISETIAEEKMVLKLKGRKEMSAALTEFLKDVDTAYHFNGQHMVTIDGDSATGILYCVITLIGTENGEKTKTRVGAVYQDNYLRKNGGWLISKRTG